MLRDRKPVALFYITHIIGPLSNCASPSLAWKRWLQHLFLKITQNIRIFFKKWLHFLSTFVCIFPLKKNEMLLILFGSIPWEKKFVEHFEALKKTKITPGGWDSNRGLPIKRATSIKTVQKKIWMRIKCKTFQETKKFEDQLKLPVHPFKITFLDSLNWLDFFSFWCSDFGSND